MAYNYDKKKRTITVGSNPGVRSMWQQWLSRARSLPRIW